MRILISTAVYHPMINGVAVFSHNLARGLVERGHEVMVVCPSQNGKNHIETIDGVKVARLKSVQVKIYPDQIHEAKGKWHKHGFRVSVFPELEVKRVMDEFRPDVVHVQVSDPIGLSVVWMARHRGIPVVTTEHNQPEVLTGPMKLPFLIKRPVNYLLSAYFRNRQSKSDFVTMPTEQAIMDLMKRKELGMPVAAVSNGVDLSNFHPGEASAETYQKYGLEKGQKYVLYVGRVDPEKQVGVIIEAFKRALSEIKQMKQAPKKLPQMVIVGDGVDKARLVRLARKLGIADSVKFLGRVVGPDLYELYKVGTVFATASEIETQGIVLIEAAATGLPLIAVNKGAVSEVCITGKDGYLCEPGNVKEIAEAMRQILTDDKLREKLAAGALKIAKEHDFEKTLDKFINIYKHVIIKK